MESHQYLFTRSSLGEVLGIPLVGCIMLAILVRTVALLPFAPSPRPTLDVDRTVIVNQVDSSFDSAAADILLIGDSSCLMDVDAAYLSELSDTQVLNLGTLSFLSLESFSKLIANYLESHPTKPNKIVMLTHPDFVRKSSTSAAHTAAFDHYIEKADHPYVSNAAWNPRAWLGIHIVEGRVLGRLPLPLTGPFRDYYGFNRELIHHMDLHAGSAVDPRVLEMEDLKGSSDYRIAKTHFRNAEAFASVIPPEVPFYIGLTPLPQEFVKRDFRSEYQALLKEWAAVFPDSIPLLELPPTLDKQQFATKTPLNEQAATEYTRRLHEHLTSLATQ